MYGITERTARAYGYTGHMRDLPLQMAVDIYISEYITKPKLDKIFDIDSALGEDMIDFGIN
ncbi:MAG: glycosyl hydrolase 108 family protein [Phocaeicola sp.]